MATMESRQLFSERCLVELLCGDCGLLGNRRSDGFFRSGSGLRSWGGPWFAGGQTQGIGWKAAFRARFNWISVQGVASRSSSRFPRVTPLLSEASFIASAKSVTPETCLPLTFWMSVPSVRPARPAESSHVDAHDVGAGLALESKLLSHVFAQIHNGEAKYLVGMEFRCAFEGACRPCEVFRHEFNDDLQFQRFSVSHDLEFVFRIRSRSFPRFPGGRQRDWSSVHRRERTTSFFWSPPCAAGESFITLSTTTTLVGSDP